VTDETRLKRECRTLGSYLIGTTPDAYVVAKYARAHAVSPVYSSTDRFELLLVRLAGANRSLARIVDAYAAVLAPTALVRRKLILLLAILETCAPSSQIIDQTGRGPSSVLLVRLFGKAVVSGVCLLVGAGFLSLPRLLLAGRVRSP
jgi:hypothetical protein